jgi:LCP family protein required for cell wall assembly
MVHAPAEDLDRSKGSRRYLRWGLAVLAALLVVGLVAGGVVYARLQGNITAADITGMLGNRRPTAAGSTDPSTNLAPLNVLVMGSDSRSDLRDAGPFGGRRVSGARSDTTLLVHLAADRRSATVVSIPRDSMVPVPSCTDPNASLAGAPVRQFNSAFTLGGPGCTVKAVEANTGVRIDHFAVLNFEGFQAMVDALGGVDVCLPRPVKDRQSRLDLPAGTSHVDGEQALAFVRVRHGIGNGSDLSRIKRQQAFLSSVVREATSTGLLLRPDRLVGFLDAATQSLTTDPAWASIKSLSATALSVRGLDARNVRFVTVPTSAYPADRNRVEWTPAAAALWQAVRLDQPLPSGRTSQPAAGVTPSAEALTVPPEQVRLTVVNASGIDGLARQAAAALRAQGFVVLGARNSVEGAVTSGTAVAGRCRPVRAGCSGRGSHARGSLSRSDR